MHWAAQPCRARLQFGGRENVGAPAECLFFGGFPRKRSAKAGGWVGARQMMRKQQHEKRKGGTYEALDKGRGDLEESCRCRP